MSSDSSTSAAIPNTISTSKPKPTKYQVKVEKYRLIAYIGFWFMCFLAMIVTKFAVAPNLGPCPKTEGAEPTYGLHCSVLVENFGFNNICVNWDYSPSREVTALVYPVFEYTLLIYIVLNYLQIKNDFDNNKVGSGILKSANVLFWVKVVLVAWFRMIFVCTVTQDPIPFFGTEISPVLGHTLGFFGMQFALILIAFENLLYAFYTNQRIFRMSPRMTKIVSVIYLSSLLIITCFKISWAMSIFATGSPWVGAPWPHIFDRMWMLLAAVLPVFFSINGMRTEPDMEIIVVNKPVVVDDVSKRTDTRDEESTHDQRGEESSAYESCNSHNVNDFPISL